jgi:cytochrome c oxidase subunit IV
MREHGLSVGAYVVIFAILVVLTLVTVGVSLAPISGAWHLTIGLSIGAVKAVLVALFFMHVIESPRLTWSIIVIALLWLVVLVALTFVDYATRGLVPGMPGH